MSHNQNLQDGLARYELKRYEKVARYEVWAENKCICFLDVLFSLVSLGYWLTCRHCSDKSRISLGDRDAKSGGTVKHQLVAPFRNFMECLPYMSFIVKVVKMSKVNHEDT